MLEINNKQARWFWLNKNLLAKPPTGAFDLMQTVKDLGFVQIDTIQNVARAHHHILWSRNQNYRSKVIDKHLGRSGDLFEHFTHDASMIPTAFFPMWRRQFTRMEEYIHKRGWHEDILATDLRDQVRERILREGPLSTEAFDTKIEGEKKMWARPPHKRMLDFMWYAGELSTSHRKGFRKYYDLMERVVPEAILNTELSAQEQIDWLCNAALERLGVANLSEIRKFWDAVSPSEVKEWAAKSDLEPVKVQAHDGSWAEMFAPADIEASMNAAIKPTSRLRIINPFDPAIRDRDRLKRLFGFDYTIEIFVPAHKRVWGYYVYPLLQDDRFVGRIELKADRKKSELNVVAFWPEGKVKWTPKRHEALKKELARFAKFGGVETVSWNCDQLAL
ncbi:winged helix-turn-helix domain-containing protein [Maritalea sp.]|uniref:winged helix-turn-helix domain-containing protein n=1 Tax=Maritalea sp. TaxID=2003361 RepID=UPI003EF5EEDE